MKGRHSLRVSAPRNLVEERLAALTRHTHHITRCSVSAKPLTQDIRNQRKIAPISIVPSVEPARTLQESSPGGYIGRQRSDKGLGLTSITKGLQGVIHRLLSKVEVMSCKKGMLNPAHTASLRAVRGEKITLQSFFLDTDSFARIRDKGSNK